MAFLSTRGRKRDAHRRQRSWREMPEATLRARSVANRKQNDHHKANDYDVDARALSHRPQSQRQSVQSIGEKLTAKAWAHVTYPNWISTKADEYESSLTLLND